MPFGLCFVGLGGYAIKVLDDLADARPALDLYFASRDGKKAKEFCDKYKGKGWFGSYEEAAADPRVEGMYFVTPHHLHLEGARLAAKHRKHILMEKPIARTVEEAEALIKTAKDAGVTLMIAENYQFTPTIAKARELVAQGLIGDLRLVQIQREAYWEQTEWRTDAEASGGGMFIDGGIHDMHAVITIGGFPERIYAARPPRVFTKSPGEDGMVLTAHLPNGAVGLVQFSFGTPISEYREQMWVTGTKGQLMFKPFGAEIIVDNPLVRRTVQVAEPHMGVPWIMREFIAASREGREPAMSGDDALGDLICVLAAYESVRTGNSVELPKRASRGPGARVHQRLQSPKKAPRHDPKALI
ncbi:MAG: Gfo/Idh/MocA family oxidoreductase [SAR202 cluster bacterium]|nr:Gfo/Idh/MocA family oxidoreductase [SAR202 cluster bacterium]